MTEQEMTDMTDISKEALSDLCEILSRIVITGVFTKENIREIITVSRWINQEDVDVN